MLLGDDIGRFEEDRFAGGNGEFIPSGKSGFGRLDGFGDILGAAVSEFAQNLSGVSRVDFRKVVA